MKNYNWGIIGTGRIAHSFAKALCGTDNAVPYAAASRTYEKAQKFAEGSGFTKAYGSYAELAGDKAVDAVYIATPMASHFEDAKLCLSAGKNVLCEKAVTLNSAQLEELFALAEKNGVFFMEAMWMKCLPVYLKAKDWVKSGRIGEITSISADFSNAVPYMPDDRLFRPDLGGGALLDMGIYPLTMAMDFLGSEPESIITSANISRGIDMSSIIQLKYPGATASVYSGFEAGLENRAAVYGTDGIILFGKCFFCSDELMLLDLRNNTTERFKAGFDINGYEFEIREFQRCLSEGLTDSPLVPHKDTLSVMRVMDDCRRQWGLRYPNE